MEHVLKCVVVVQIFILVIVGKPVRVYTVCDELNNSCRYDTDLPEISGKHRNPPCRKVPGYEQHKYCFKSICIFYEIKVVRTIC